MKRMYRLKDFYVAGRVFLKVFIIICLTIVFNDAFGVMSGGGGEIIRFNTEYNLKRMSNGEIIITHPDEPGNKDLTFTDFYADILLAAYRNQRIDYIIKTCAGKYFSSEDECRREVKHAVNVLSGWDIIKIDRTMAER